MPWNDFLAGDQVGSLDPLNILQSITGSAVPQNAVGMPSAAPKIPNVPRSAIPAKPMLPGPAVSAVQPGGSADWKALLEQIGPLLAGSLVGNQASRTGFMSGYMNGHGLAQEERQKREAAQQQKNQASANFRLEVGQHAMAIDDPVQRAQFIDLAESSGVTAGLLKTGDLSALRTVPAGQADAKKRKELTAKIKGLEDAGYKVDTLPPDTTITLDDGSTELLSTAIAEARYRPTSGGKPLAAPGKDKRGFVREQVLMTGQTTPREINYDPDLGKYSDPESGTIIPTTAFTKFTSPSLGGENERAAATLGQIREAKAKGDTVTATRLQAQYDDLMKVRKESAAAGRDPLLEAVRALQANPGGGLTDDAVDYAATQYRVTGVMPSMGRSSGGRTAIVNRAAQQAKDLGQSPAAAIQKQAAYKADTSALTQMRKMSSSAEAFETKARAQADIVESLSAKVDRTQYPIINDGLLAGKARIAGDANTQLLYNALATFTTEYAKIMEGSTGSAAGSSESARASASKLISAGLNKGTLSQTIALMRKEMALTIQGYDATIEHITTRMGGAVPPPDAPSTTPKRQYYDATGKPVTK